MKGPLRDITLIKDSDFVRNFLKGIRLMLTERTTRIYFMFILFVLCLGLFGPYINPYDYDERVRDDDGSLLQFEEPSLDHPLGTTENGYDVFSRLLWGARPTAIAGALGGTLIISIGLTIGLVSGYVGGRVDDVLMRFTDLVYGVPLIPFALVMAALLGVGFIESIVIVGLVLWRGSARVIRSQVLQIRERPFILAARASGASRRQIIVKHILPNVAPMAVLFFALGTGTSIIMLAGLAFLGVTNPFIPSWGVMVRNAYDSGYVATAWWWSVPPGLLISMTVVSLFMFGRGYERIAQGDQDARMADESIAQAN